MEPVTFILRKDWILRQVKLLDGPLGSIQLTVSAFDDYLFLKPLKQLSSSYISY